MKQTVYRETFIEAFNAIRPDNFSYNGLNTLFEMITDIEESCGEEIELDVIAICCDFSELTIDDFFDEYDVDMEGFTDERDAIENYLQDNGGDYRWSENGGSWSIVFWSAF